ncbi:MAG: hypothetical protein JJW01_03190, partial [Alphaproteobacteria bacterium]|nr:hypothetical protein [Rickettsiales bacterium]
LTSEGKLLKKYTAGLNKLKPNRDSSKDTIFCILRDKLIPETTPNTMPKIPITHPDKKKIAVVLDS